jgi:hypothetical protein
MSCATTLDETPRREERGLAAVGEVQSDALYVYPDPLTARFAKATIEFVAPSRDCRRGRYPAGASRRRSCSRFDEVRESD